MDKNPKRRKYQDNPYSISKDEKRNLYVVSFKDMTGVIQKVEISKEIWEVFDEYERLDISQMNEFDRHTEHSEIYEESLVKRANEKTISLEDEFIRQSTFQELKNAIDKLPKIYKRRIKRYYFDDKNEVEIALEEGTSQQAISKSLKVSIEKLKEILKNFQK